MHGVLAVLILAGLVAIASPAAAEPPELAAVGEPAVDGVASYAGCALNAGSANQHIQCVLTHLVF